MSARERDQEREFSCHIQKHLGVIAKTPRGWTKELNVVSFNEMPARYDIRDWDEDHKKMSRGISMTKDEVLSLRDLLVKVPFSSDNKGGVTSAAAAEAGAATEARAQVEEEDAPAAAFEAPPEPQAAVAGMA